MEPTSRKSHPKEEEMEVLNKGAEDDRADEENSSDNDDID